MKQSEVIDEGFKDFIAGALSGANMDQTKNLYTAHMNTQQTRGQPAQGGGPSGNSGGDDDYDDDGEYDDSGEDGGGQPPPAPDKSTEFVRQVKGKVHLALEQNKLTREELGQFMKMLRTASLNLPDELADGSEPIQIRHIKQQVNRDIVGGDPAVTKPILDKFINNLKMLVKVMH